MKNLERQTLEKIPESIREQLMIAVKDFILAHTSPQKIIFFGSILTERFDACSDIDVIATYDSLQSADQARRTLYRTRRPDLGHSLEILCADAETYRIKSQIGGVYFVAREEGREADLQMSPRM